ncbi:DoxX family protein [Sphingomonas canadensis]|uniref:DoxX family protein n=1 Tax=Sphingomonas canadensis TaxID=1219257 RepID=A0ABW3HCP7_9SPHN|nr:DoxX family membrane protein [Sphingomonas canadensis]MCW3838287.1 hypothetical protein [Sphingomonas canadensis]
MGDVQTRNRALGTWGLRMMIGLLSFQLAMFKLFIDGLEWNMQWFEKLRVWFPDWVLRATNIYAAVFELVGGALLILGLKRDWGLYMILSVLVVVTFGHGMEAAGWDIQQAVFRMAMVVALLLLPAEWDVLRLDTLLARNTGNKG